MIGRLRGLLARKAPQGVIVDVGGVGYEVAIPLSTFYTLPGEGETVTLEISTQVREDAFLLFGFASFRERQLFEQLITVSKIGPKLAIVILSGLPADDLCAAISAGDIARLSTIPGVGAKTAERLALELRGKVRSVAPAAVPGAGAGAPVTGDGARLAVEDAAAALVNLGYRPRDAEKAVARAARDGARHLEGLIRKALSLLSG